MIRTLYPKALALPCLTMNDLITYLEEATESFIDANERLVGGKDNVSIEVDQWYTGDEDEKEYNEFDLPIRIDVAFQDDVHTFQGEEEPMSFTIFINGLQNFAVDFTSMVTYQIFLLDTVSRGSGEKYQYEEIYMKLIDYIATRKANVFPQYQLH